MTDRDWYKDAIVYELHVRAFQDSDADGIGDFAGLTQRLDYLQELGVTAVWLLPFYVSPLRDDGYDIAGYRQVHPAYGDLDDFKRFLDEAHRRDLRVITELVLNHTSDAHPWFQRARRAPPGSPERDFYVWSDSGEEYRGARIIFKDFETSNWAWDPVAKAYYWHRFYSHQPDLNFDNPAVREEMLAVLDFWLDMGVDGLRLDAVPYLYERPGTNCENLPETHGFLRQLRRHVDDEYEGRMLLAEANQWPEDAVAYFGDGDECHMAFHFPLMPRMFMALQMEDRFPIVDILDQTPDLPEPCQWALFLRNHDELTLEMVTDEERDYMYRVYARHRRMRINLGIRRRLAPLLGNDRKKIQLINGLLFSMPGTPVIYYGDEVGMGDNFYLGDRDGVRTPMQWSPDRNAGFSRANPHSLYLPVIIDAEYHYETINVEAQHDNPNSLLWWMRRLIAFRKAHPALARGNLRFLLPDNPKVLAFVREHEGQRLLVVANLSRFSQYVELDLSEHEGIAPLEAFGQTRFPRIGELPYLLTLGPHDFYFFELAPEEVAEEALVGADEAARIPVLRTDEGLAGLMRGRSRALLAELLLQRLGRRRWFAGKGRRAGRGRIAEAVEMGSGASLLILHVEYLEGEPDDYLVPLALARGEAAREMLEEDPETVLLRLQPLSGGPEAVLYDALRDGDLALDLLRLIERGDSLRGENGIVRAHAFDLHRLLSERRSGRTGLDDAAATPAEGAAVGAAGPAEDADTAPPAVRRKDAGAAAPDRLELAPRPLDAEQSNTSIAYDDALILKAFRRLTSGTNPELELVRYLARCGREVRVPRLAGYLEYEPFDGDPTTLAVVEELIANQGDAWTHTLDAVGRYFEHIMPLVTGNRRRDGEAHDDLDGLARRHIATYLDSAELLGRRTAELHNALAGEREDPAFVPEPFSELYLRALYQSLRNLAGRTLRLLQGRLEALPEGVRPEAEAVLQMRQAIVDRFSRLLDRELRASRIRVHGDYHLGQVLFTGKDFVIIDFEGEPARPVGERRIKRSPLQDVAGMLRSFEYACYTGLSELRDRTGASPEELDKLEHWARFWCEEVGDIFLGSYLRQIEQPSLLPETGDDIDLLLDIHLLEKAVYELGYELNHRPDWVEIPLRGIRRILEAGAERGQKTATEVT